MTALTVPVATIAPLHLLRATAWGGLFDPGGVADSESPGLKVAVTVEFDHSRVQRGRDAGLFGRDADLAVERDRGEDVLGERVRGNAPFHAEDEVPNDDLVAVGGAGDQRGKDGEDAQHPR